MRSVPAAHVGDTPGDRVRPRIEHRPLTSSSADPAGEQAAGEQPAAERRRRRRSCSASVAYDDDTARHLADPLALAPAPASVIVSPPPLSSAITGQRVASATIRSTPVSTSSTHRQLTGSLPPALRRNTTRLPSGDHREVAGLAEGQSLGPRVLARERVAHRAILTRRSDSIRPRSRFDHDLGVGSGLPRSAKACGTLVHRDRPR